MDKSKWGYINNQQTTKPQEKQENFNYLDKIPPK